MKLFGALLLCGGAFLLLDRFTAYRRAREAECAGFLAFLSFLRRQIACFARPVPQAAEGFSDAALERVGFLPALRETGDLSAAWQAALFALSLGEAEREVVGEFFASFGKGYLDDEVRRADAAIDELTRLFEAGRRQMPRTVKLVRTLTVSLTLCAVILLL